MKLQLSSSSYFHNLAYLYKLEDTPARQNPISACDLTRPPLITMNIHTPVVFVNDFSMIFNFLPHTIFPLTRMKEQIITLGCYLRVYWTISPSNMPLQTRVYRPIVLKWAVVTIILQAYFLVLKTIGCLNFFTDDWLTDWSNSFK